MAKRMENNFKRAVNELLSPGIREVEVQNTVPEPEPVPEETPEASFEVPLQSELPIAPPRREEALIPSEMVVTGNVASKSDMKIFGSIMGDLECEGNVELHGRVQGNVSAVNLMIQRGGLHGDAVVRENLVIEDESVVVGNLTAGSIHSNARTEGHMQATGLVKLREKAYVHGNIDAGDLAVECGAKIKGMVNISE